LGKEYDGGYVIIDVPKANYDILISGGILDDISFEEHFIEKYKTRCVTFDGTIPELPKKNDKIHFIRKNIGSDNTDATTNLHILINEHKNLFIKMDIEGGEIPWLKCLSDEQVNKFEQIVMEFHFPFSEKEKDTFDKLNKHHVLVHFHANNCCGTRTHNGVVIPNVFECTYLHKKHFTSSPELNKESIPGPLDMKNLLKHDEIYINHPPFVN